MENLVRTLRLALGMTQVKFADLAGVAYSTEQQWEAGRRVPMDGLDRLIAIALDRQLVDLAAQLRRLRDPTSADPAATYPAFRHQHWHEMLDYVLDSSNPKAIAAVKTNLVVFADYVGKPETSYPKTASQRKAK